MSLFIWISFLSSPLNMDCVEGCTVFLSTTWKEGSSPQMEIVVAWSFIAYLSVQPLYTEWEI